MRKAGGDRARPGPLQVGGGRDLHVGVVAGDQPDLVAGLLGEHRLVGAGGAAAPGVDGRGEHVAPERLRRLRQEQRLARQRRDDAGVAGRHLLHRVVHRHGRDDGAAGEGAVDGAIDHVGGDERPRRVVDEDHRRVGGHRGEALGDGVLPPRAARHDAARRRRGRHRRVGRARRHHDDDLGDARVRVEGGDGSLEQGASADRQPLLGDAGAEARALAAGRDDHGHAHASPSAGECINRAVSTPPAQAPTRSAVSDTARAPSAAGVDAGTNSTKSDARRRGRHRRAQRIRGRVAERALGVDQRQAAGDVDAVLADAVVALAVGAEPQRQRVAGDAIAIVDAERDLRLDRAPVAEIDDGVDPRQRVAAPHAPQQRLGRRPRLGRIEADGAIQRARPLHGLVERRAAGPQPRLGLGERRVEAMVVLDDGDAVEGEAGGRDDRGERRGEVERHADTASVSAPGPWPSAPAIGVLHLAGEGARLVGPRGRPSGSDRGR